MYVNAITLHRLGRRLQERHVPFLPRLLEWLIYLGFNCSIPLTAVIGEGTRCEHRGIGVVVHERSVIGERCRLFPHVVIGSLGSSVKGAPVIGNDVTIWAGAAVLGPITIGNGAVIGANAVVLRDVPPNATVVGIPAREIAATGEQTRHRTDAAA